MDIGDVTGMDEKKFIILRELINIELIPKKFLYNFGLILDIKPKFYEKYIPYFGYIFLKKRITQKALDYINKPTKLDSFPKLIIIEEQEDWKCIN